MGTEKKELRKRILALRKMQSGDLIRTRSLRAEDNFFSIPEIKDNSFLMLYASNDNEVQTYGIMKRCLAEGRRVAVPSLRRSPGDITASLIISEDELQEGLFGLREPAEERIRPVNPGLLQAVVVPGVAFDRRGGRLGFGGGFYDRFLGKTGKNAVIVGLAFEFQIIERVPMETKDVPVHKVVTEDAVYDCRVEEGIALRAQRQSEP